LDLVEVVPADMDVGPACSSASTLFMSISSSSSVSAALAFPFPYLPSKSSHSPYRHLHSFALCTHTLTRRLTRMSVFDTGAAPDTATASARFRRRVIAVQFVAEYELIVVDSPNRACFVSVVYFPS